MAEVMVMETFAVVLIGIVAVIALIMLLGGMGLLFYGLWLRWWVEPSRQMSHPQSFLKGNQRQRSDEQRCHFNLGLGDAVRFGYAGRLWAGGDGSGGGRPAEASPRHVRPSGGDVDGSRAGQAWRLLAFARL